MSSQQPPPPSTPLPVKSAGPTRSLTPIEKQVITVRQALASATNEIARALPKHMSADRMLRIAMTSIIKTPKLLECDIKSLIGAVIQSAQLGLEPDNVMGQAYLVPFKGKVQLIPGYKGLVQLAYRSALVASIEARIVRKGDEFDYGYGTKPYIVHKPGKITTFDAGKAEADVVAAYTVAHLKSGAVVFEVMQKAEIDAIRRRSKAQSDGPWVTDFEEMAKKSPTRRVCKMLPASTIAMQTAVSLDERHEIGLAQNLEMLTDGGAGEFIDVPSEDVKVTPGSQMDAMADKLDGKKPDPAQPPVVEREPGDDDNGPGGLFEPAKKGR